MTICGSQTRKTADQTEPDAGLPLRTPDTAHILIVSDNDSDVKELKIVFQKAGLTSESAPSITAGCASAISRRFQVIFSTPVMADGSWRRLIDVANHYGLSFEVILLARNFDFNQWGEALQMGAFDVLDVLCDLPKAAEAARRALGTDYLKRFRGRHERV
jgi:DNA-binding NtrC family response regulator